MKKAITAGWIETTVGGVLTLEYGKSFPERKREPGPYVVYGSNGEIGRAHQYFLEDRTIVIGRKGSAGEVILGEPKSWPIDTTYYVHVRDTAGHSLDFLYYLLKWLDPRRFVERTTKPGLNRDRVYERVVTIPPLPVQERIVEVLQKADDVRRKRKEAVELAAIIRRALFDDAFGDPEVNPHGWPLGPLNDLLQPEIERVNPARAFPDQEFRYIEIAGINDFRIMETKGILGIDAPSRARQVVRTGDVLYSLTRPNLRNIAVVPDELDGAICTTGFAVLRPRSPEDSSFVFEIVKSDYFTQAMSRFAEAKSLYPAVDEPQVRRFPIIQPPSPARAHFGAVVGQLEQVALSSRFYFEATEGLFTSLLSRAFTGELTAEWEAANADWIAAQVELQERLPRLLLLALIRETAARAGKAARAAVLVTALMKYAFLLQMEGNGRRRFYQFIPYHYGPFAKEVYADLERLQADGLVTVDEDAEEEKTRIALADPAKADASLADLPDDLKADVSSILDAYGDLDHNALLRAVYDKYPAYAKASRVRQRARARKRG